MPIFRYPFFYNPNYPLNQHKINYISPPPSYTYKNQENNPNNVSNSAFAKNSNPSPNEKNAKNDEEIRKTEEPRSNLANEKNNSKSKSETNYFFELFGLKLYFDDILLICLIFFLYQEGVKDDELFISLILLLLS